MERYYEHRAHIQPRDQACLHGRASFLPIKIFGVEESRREEDASGENEEGGVEEEGEGMGGVVERSDVREGVQAPDLCS